MTKRSGFTLIELVVTLAILGVLTSVALPLGEIAVQRAKEQELRRSLREIREAIDAYKQAFDEGRIARRPDDSGYPKRLEDLASGVQDEKNPKKERLYFLRRVPRDPFAADPSIGPVASWGKRSYASPPDEPREGDDVFDIFTRSSAIGLNGRPLREW